jgi:hypothetical protein
VPPRQSLAKVGPISLVIHSFAAASTARKIRKNIKNIDTMWHVSYGSSQKFTSLQCKKNPLPHPSDAQGARFSHDQCKRRTVQRSYTFTYSIHNTHSKHNTYTYRYA